MIESDLKVQLIILSYKIALPFYQYKKPRILESERSTAHVVPNKISSVNDRSVHGSDLEGHASLFLLYKITTM